MENEIRIVVATHKKYQMPLDEMYIPLQVGAAGKKNKDGTPLDFGYMRDDSGDNISDKNYKVFTTLFYGHSTLRPCCYECPYKSVIHPGDITIADYWGIEKAAPEFDDNKGVSLVLVNNEKGNELFDAIKDGVKWQETRLEDSMQPPLKAPFPKPVERKVFWDDFENKNFDYITKKYGGAGIGNRVKVVLRKIKRKLIG